MTAAAAAASLAADPARAERRRPHVAGFDLIRLLVIGFVVGVHTLSNGGGTVTPLLGGFITVFHTSRELFFLLTALVLTYNYGQRPGVRWRPFWRRRYLLVVPAYLAWSLIYFLADGTSLNPLPAALRLFRHELLTGGARYHLYFLLVTMQVYLVFPLVRWLLRRTAGHHLALAIAAGAYQVALTVAIQHHVNAPRPIGTWLHAPAEWLPSYVLYVIGGALAGWHFERLAAFTRRHARAALLTAAAGAGTGAAVYCAEVYLGGQPPVTASAVFQPVLIVETLAYGWGLLAAGLRWSQHGARWRRHIAAGADCSFGIYLAHPLVLQGLLILAKDTGLLGPVRRAPAASQAAVFLLVCVPVVYGVSWALAFVLRRSPLSLVLTGRPSMRRLARPRMRWVLLGTALLCAAIAGASWLTVRGDAAASPRPVRISRSTRAAGTARLVTSVYSIQSGGQRRQWTQVSPRRVLPASAPVIVVLSGINATVSLEIKRDRLTSYVLAGKAELVYPAGYLRSWNAGGCCGKAAKAGVDDTGFLKALVAAVDPGHQHPVDLVGYSNGGRLAYRIACTDPGLVDQIAVVKAMPQPGCVVSHPVSILQIASTNDTSVPYQPGDKGKESPPATVEISRLNAADRCPARTTVETRGSLAMTTWHDCADDTQLGFAVYAGGKHSFPQPSGATPSGAAVIWAFFTNSGQLPAA